MSEAKRGRGRPRQSIDRAAITVDWKTVPVLCDIGIVAKTIGFSYETVRRWMADGTMPAVQIGGEWRIRKDALMAYVGYLPWQVLQLGYGITVDRSEQLRDEFEAGRQMMSIVG